MTVSERTGGEFVIGDYFDASDVENALSCLKFGKASGIDGVSKESIIHAHPSVIVHMKCLFNNILKHGFVPDAFVPVLKDKYGDLTSSSNYRPITLSPFISKIFEYCILYKYEHFVLL